MAIAKEIYKEPEPSLQPKSEWSQWHGGDPWQFDIPEFGEYGTDWTWVMGPYGDPIIAPINPSTGLPDYYEAYIYNADAWGLSEEEVLDLYYEMYPEEPTQFEFGEGTPSIIDKPTPEKRVPDEGIGEHPTSVLPEREDGIYDLGDVVTEEESFEDMASIIGAEETTGGIPIGEGVEIDEETGKPIGDVPDIPDWTEEYQDWEGFQYDFNNDGTVDMLDIIASENAGFSDLSNEIDDFITSSENIDFEGQMIEPVSDVIDVSDYTREYLETIPEKPAIGEITGEPELPEFGDEEWFNWLQEQGLIDPNIDWGGAGPAGLEEWDPSYEGEIPGAGIGPDIWLGSDLSYEEIQEMSGVDAWLEALEGQLGPFANIEGLAEYLASEYPGVPPEFLMDSGYWDDILDWVDTNYQWGFFDEEFDVPSRKPGRPPPDFTHPDPAIHQQRPIDISEEYQDWLEANPPTDELPEGWGWQLIDNEWIPVDLTLGEEGVEGIDYPGGYGSIIGEEPQIPGLKPDVPTDELPEGYEWGWINSEWIPVEITRADLWEDPTFKPPPVSDEEFVSGPEGMPGYWNPNIPIDFPEDPGLQWEYNFETGEWDLAEIGGEEEGDWEDPASGWTEENWEASPFFEAGYSWEDWGALPYETQEYLGSIFTGLGFGGGDEGSVGYGMQVTNPEYSDWWQDAMNYYVDHIQDSAGDPFPTFLDWMEEGPTSEYSTWFENNPAPQQFYTGETIDFQPYSADFMTDMIAMELGWEIPIGYGHFGEGLGSDYLEWIYGEEWDPAMVQTLTPGMIEKLEYGYYDPIMEQTRSQAVQGALQSYGGGYGDVLDVGTYEDMLQQQIQSGLLGGYENVAGLQGEALGSVTNVMDSWAQLIAQLEASQE